MLLMVTRCAKHEVVRRSSSAPKSRIRWHLLARFSMLLWAFFLISWIAQRAAH